MDIELISVSAYNARFEEKSDDRMLKPASLNNVLIKDFSNLNEVAYEMNTKLTGTIILEGKGFNYLKIKSKKIFESSENPTTQYFFITGTSKNEGHGVYTYDIKLDVMMTYGEAWFLNNLELRQVLISRKHEDRWLYNSLTSNFDINKEYHSLINSDFKMDNTKGQTIEYYGKSQNDVSTTGYRFGGVNDGTFSNTYKTYVDNTPNISDMYVYAILNRKGEPVINGSGPLFDHLNNYIIMPIKTSTTLNNFYKDFNTYQSLSKLPAGKVVSVFLSPMKITFKAVNSGGTPITNDLINYFEYNDGTSTLRYYYHDIVNTGFEFDTTQSFENIIFTDFVDLETEITSSQMLSYLIANDFKALETSVLNGDIIKHNFVIADQYQENLLDIYKVLKNNTLKITGSYDEMGVYTKCNIADHHYISYEYVKQLTTISDAGATYLQQNSSQIANARAQALNREISLYEIQTRDRWSIGGIFNAVMSSGGSFTEKQLASDDARFERHMIQSKIDDASATSPTVEKASSTNTHFSTMKDSEFSNYNKIWNIQKITPNDILLNKIVRYQDKFGSLYDDWKVFRVIEDLNSRTRFNYLKLENVLNYIDVFYTNPSNPDITVDVDIANEFARLLENGVRIWKDVIYIGNYNDMNYEKGIETAVLRFRWENEYDDREDVCDECADDAIQLHLKELENGKSK